NPRYKVRWEPVGGIYGRQNGDRAVAARVFSQPQWAGGAWIVPVAATEGRSAPWPPHPPFGHLLPQGEKGGWGVGRLRGYHERLAPSSAPSGHLLPRGEKGEWGVGWMVPRTQDHPSPLVGEGGAQRRM